MTFEGLNSTAELHTEANFNVFAFEMFAIVWLLVLCLITIWFFKEKQIHFIHESGLALFYGKQIKLLLLFVKAWNFSQFQAWSIKKCKGRGQTVF
jgi:hypothetical protein